MGFSHSPKITRVVGMPIMSMSAVQRELALLTAAAAEWNTSSVLLICCLVSGTHCVLVNSNVITNTWSFSLSLTK